MSKRTAFIVTGDSFITRRLPTNKYEGFTELQNLINEHDVKFTNLEMTIHRQEGFPAAVSGGTWAMAEPEILDDLKQFGFNLYNTANNHSGDYSHGGLLATIDYLRERNMLFAGTGSNLYEATAATYLDTRYSRVALIGACSSFHESHAAGNQGYAMQGRPGLNPLRFQKTVHVEKSYFDTLTEIADETQMNAEIMLSIKNGYIQPLPNDSLYFGEMIFKCDGNNAVRTSPLQKDMDRMIAAIKEAKLQADYVLVSIHSHEFAGEDIVEPAEFLKIFCHACIDVGADVILGHGPHELRGIEIYKGKPIFYSLGNFIFQTETISVQPVEAYENAGLAPDTMVGSYMNIRSGDGSTGLIVQPNIWRSVMPSFVAEDGRISTIKLYPISLNMNAPRSRIGFPKLSYDVEVLKYLAELSKPFGTDVVIEDDYATIVLD